MVPGTSEGSRADNLNVGYSFSTLTPCNLKVCKFELPF
jgi:hypothetical protein